MSKISNQQEAPMKNGTRSRGRGFIAKTLFELDGIPANFSSVVSIMAENMKSACKEANENRACKTFLVGCERLSRKEKIDSSEFSRLYSEYVDLNVRLGGRK